MKKTTFLIVGRHAVTEALRNPKRKVHRLFITEDALKKLNRDNQSENLVKQVHVFYKTKREIDNLCGKEDISHQNIVAEVESIENTTIKEYLKNTEKKNINFLALEEVTDPRNIGSIIRCATSFNLDGLIVKERSFPFKSKLLFKSASGGMEHLNIFKVSNINTALKFLREKNFWVYGFDAKSSKNFTEIEWKGNNILLFGSEGFGIKKHTEKYTDFLVKIEINQNIESLNISNSAAIAFHQVMKMKK
jgi:23S rRNA (guanosine2251-2'-O)-methyltransferase